MPRIQVPPLNLGSLDLSSPDLSPPTNPHRAQFLRPKSAGEPDTLGRLPLTPDTHAHSAQMVQRLSQAFDPAVRAVGWRQRYNDTGSYAGNFWEAAVLEASRLHSRPGHGLVDLLHGLAQRRHAMATAARDCSEHLFGRWRNPAASDGLMTTIGGVYATDRSVRAFLPRFLAGDTGDLADHIMDFSLGERPLWTIVARLPSGHEAELTTWDGSADPPRWWHATPSAEIVAHLEDLFRAAWTHPGDDLAGLQVKVARLQWWMAHACIFARGSAGISDMVATTVLWHHGYKRPRPCKETSIDLAAICSPRESDFVAGYASLFERAPVAFGPLTERDAHALLAPTRRAEAPQE